MTGVGLNTAMNVADRPVTQQGLSGMKTAGHGPARQIQDNSYYIQQLRAKCDEVQQEIGVLKGNIDQAQKDNQDYGQLERVYEKLSNEMRALQGQLADYNLMLDRNRVHKNVDDILEECRQLEQANASERHRVDELLTHRQHLEGQGREVEQQLHQHNQEMARRLESVEPQMQQHFLELQDMHEKFTVHELPKKQADLNYFSERCAEMEQAMAQDPSRGRMYNIREEIGRLQRQHQLLSEELDGPQLSLPQQKEMLLQKVKADNAEIAEAERQIVELQEAVRSGRSKLSSLETDLVEANDPKKQKYQELFQKDKEMSEVIDTFDATKAKEEGAISKAQQDIVRLLQAISRKTEHLQNASGMNSDKYNEMKSDLDFKQMQMDNSASTSERLQVDLDRRNLELQKIQMLDQKIELELKEKREKMVSMEREVEEFKDLRKLKADAQRQSEELRMKKEAAQGRKQGLKEEAKKHRAKYEEIKASLASDELAKKIDELEQRVKHQESTVYALSDYIETKGAESHFEPIAEDCTLKCKALNTETIRVLAEAPVFAGGFY
jgi:intraflagellar transport protein 74